MAKTFKYLYIILFCIGISLPGLLMLKSDPEKEKSEEALQIPDTTSLKDYPQLFTSYFDKSFGLKKELISNFYRTRIFFLNENFIDEKVINGKEGWLFYGPSQDGFGIEDFSGKIKLSEEELQKIKVNLEQQNNWLKKRGIKFLVVVCPNKQTIYPEYLPEGFEKGASVLEQIENYLKQNNADVPFLNLTSTLKEIKKNDTNWLYYKTDSHWNYYGAYFGYKKICEELKKQGININPSHNFNFKRVYSPGRDITEMIGLESSFDDEQVEIEKSEIKDFSCKNPRAVIFQDSYLNYAKPYFELSLDTLILRPHFWNSFDYKLIEESKPDVVIYQMVERYVGQVRRETPPEIFK